MYNCIMPKLVYDHSLTIGLYSMESQNLSWRYLTEDDSEEYNGQQFQPENETLVSWNKTSIIIIHVLVIIQT